MKTTRTLVVLGTCALVLSTGCRKREAPEAEGKELSKNPIAALGQIQDAVKKAEQAAKESQEMKAVEPVHFSKLIELLPKAPSGWTADGEPRGETTNAMGFKVSMAEQSFSAEGKSLQVKITDGAFNAPLYTVITMAAQFARESTEGYEKGVTLDGNPGIEKWRKDGGDAELNVVIGKRFFVEIQGSNITPELVRKVWDSVDRTKLAGLK
ncbi:MAG: hypothetical protein IPP07_04675 [Holophagales bacterium]|nr:hypothetical protein [Holophagales bacterium]MBK9964219.1 hypothetical protein [Holophagales bacterium]